MKTQKKQGIKKGINLLVKRSFLTIGFVLAITLSSYAFSELTQREISGYLADKGYTIVSVKHIENSEDWISLNADRSHTRVYVIDGNIVGHEDIDW